MVGLCIDGNIYTFWYILDVPILVLLCCIGRSIYVWFVYGCAVCWCRYMMCGCTVAALHSAALHILLPIYDVCPCIGAELLCVFCVWRFYCLG